MYLFVIKSQTVSCNFVTVKGSKTCLLGKDLLNKIVIDWKSGFKVERSRQNGIDELLSSHHKLFECEKINQEYQE